MKCFKIAFSNGSVAGLVQAEDSLDIAAEVLMLRLSTRENFTFEEVSRSEYERLLAEAAKDHEMTSVNRLGSLFDKSEEVQ